MDRTFPSGKGVTEQQLRSNVQKLITNETQNLQRFSLRKYNPETTLEDSYQVALSQILDNIIKLQDELYTLTWEIGIGGHLFDIPII